MPDIVKKVFGDHTTADFKLELTGTYRKWNYCVQYRETDFNFVSRLMEEEGIYLLRQAHGRPQYRGAHRFHEQAHGDSRLREDPVHRSRAGRAAGARAHQQLGLFARDPAGRLRARRLRSGAAERRAEDAEGPASRATRRATTKSTTTPATICRRRTANSTRACASTSSAASSRPRRRSTNAKGVAVGSLFTLDDYPREDQNREHLIRGGELRPGIQRLRSDAGGRRHELSVQLRRDVEPAAVPAEAGHAQAVRAGAADRGGRRSGRRRDLHRQVRAREGAVPLGSLRQEGREQLVLDPRVAAVGGQGVGRRSRRRASARR